MIYGLKAQKPLKQHALKGQKQHALKGQKQHALKTQKFPEAARPESFAPHALKGQKLLAQGNALGNYERKPVAL